MDDLITDSELRHVRATRRLSGYRQCHNCSETDVRCLELHHIAGQAYHGDLVPVCRNCHRKLSDGQRDHPDQLPGTMLDVIGRYLLGLSDFFAELAKRLQEFGRFLCGYEDRPAGDGS